MDGQAIRANIPRTLAAFFFLCSQQRTEASNKELYEKVGRRVVERVLDGFNGTVLAYGQTGSGKTHTIFGSNSQDDAKGLQEESKSERYSRYRSGDEAGVIQLALRELFEGIDARCSDRDFLVRVSYLEIYQEKIYDLLGETQGVSLKIVKEDPVLGVVVRDLQEMIVDGPETVLELLEQGEEMRHFRATNMNKRSSRSHTVFRLIVESSSKSEDCSQSVDSSASNDGVVVSCLSLVDLAGSERQSKARTSGESLKEGSNINKSLLALREVISGLTSNKESNFIPYRNSKLTRVLRQALGGNAVTALICAVANTKLHEQESINTLKFGVMCKQVKNRALRNAVSSRDALIETYRQEVKNLKQSLSDQQKQTQAIQTALEEKSKQLEQQRKQDKKREENSALNDDDVAEKYAVKAQRWWRKAELKRLEELREKSKNSEDKARELEEKLACFENIKSKGHKGYLEESPSLPSSESNSSLGSLELDTQQQQQQQQEQERAYRGSHSAPTTPKRRPSIAWVVQSRNAAENVLRFARNLKEQAAQRADTPQSVGDASTSPASGTKRRSSKICDDDNGRPLSPNSVEKQRVLDDLDAALRKLDAERQRVEQLKGYCHELEATNALMPQEQLKAIESWENDMNSWYERSAQYNAETDERARIVEAHAAQVEQQTNVLETARKALEDERRHLQEQQRLLQARRDTLDEQERCVALRVLDMERSLATRKQALEEAATIRARTLAEEMVTDLEQRENACRDAEEKLPVRAAEMANQELSRRRASTTRVPRVTGTPVAASTAAPASTAVSDLAAASPVTTATTTASDFEHHPGNGGLIIDSYLDQANYESEELERQKVKEKELVARSVSVEVSAQQLEQLEHRLEARLAGIEQAEKRNLEREHELKGLRLQLSEIVSRETSLQLRVDLQNAADKKLAQREELLRERELRLAQTGAGDSFRAGMSASREATVLALEEKIVGSIQEVQPTIAFCKEKLKSLQAKDEETGTENAYLPNQQVEAILVNIVNQFEWLEANVDGLQGIKAFLRSFQEDLLEQPVKRAVLPSREPDTTSTSVANSATPPVTGCRLTKDARAVKHLDSLAKVLGDILTVSVPIIASASPLGTQQSSEAYESDLRFKRKLLSRYLSEAKIILTAGLLNARANGH